MKVKLTYPPELILNTKFLHRCQRTTSDLKGTMDFRHFIVFNV